jgi:diguanylate cyclase (GGDEF)-like protein
MAYSHWLRLHIEMGDPVLDGIDKSQVNDEIERLRRNRFRSLNFSRTLEERFERDTAKERSHRLWLEGLLAILALNFCLAADFLLVKDVSLVSLLARTAVITPLALAANYMMRRNPKRWVREGSVAAATTLISFVNLYAEGNVTAATTTFGMMSVLITVLFADVVMRIRFLYMAGSTMVMLAGGLWFALESKGLMGSEKIIGVSMMTLGILMTLTAGYSLEGQERVSYLLFLRSELQGEELHRISSQDKLTGLPNRRAFEERFERLWVEGGRAATPLSVIVIDIDHFKAVNDQHGHLYGDEVLRRVAGLLPQALRGKNDLATRFGGEEFVILLPNTRMENAVDVADRIRRLIETAGMPGSNRLPDSPMTLATVSCGVSSYVPDGRINHGQSAALRPRAARSFSLRWTEGMDLSLAHRWGEAARMATRRHRCTFMYRPAAWE